jgi:hypothetical protein
VQKVRLELSTSKKRARASTEVKGLPGRTFARHGQTVGDARARSKRPALHAFRFSVQNQPRQNLPALAG